MKKTSKSTGSAGSGKPRHAKSTKAPVTIDLKAKEIRSASKLAEKAKTTEKPVPAANKSASLRPEPKAEQSTAQKSAQAADSKKESPKRSEPTRTSSTASDRQRPTDHSNTNFGRNPTGPTVKGKQVEAERAPTRNKQSSGWFGGLVAGIVGGLIVLVGFSIFQFTRPAALQSTSGDYVSTETLTTTQTELNNKIAALQAELKKSQSTGGGQVDLTSINSEIDAKLKDASTAAELQITKMSDQVTETGEKLAQLEEQFKTVKDSLVTLEASGTGDVNSATSPLLTKRFEEIAGQIESTNNRLAELQTSGQNQIDDTKIVTALTAIAALETTLPKIENDLKADFAGQFKTTAEKIAALEEAQGTIPELSKNLTELSDNLSALKQLNSDQQQTIAVLQEQTKTIANKESQAAGSIAAAALKGEIDSGQPFAASLQVLENLVGKTKEMTELSKFAETGVPTMTSLTDQFKAVGDTILSATKPKQEGDLSDRLLSGLRSFVKTTPVKPQEGNTPGAIVSQITAAMTSGDAENASKLWSSLPEAGQKISQDWHTSLQARVSADQLVSKTVQSFLQPSTSQ